MGVMGKKDDLGFGRKSGQHPQGCLCPDIIEVNENIVYDKGHGLVFFHMLFEAGKPQG